MTPIGDDRTLIADALATTDGEPGPLIKGDGWSTWGDAIELAGEYLTVDKRDPSRRHDVQATREMAFEFARLWRKTNDEPIRDFARRYGLLELCSHQLTMGHPDSSVPIGLAHTGAVGAWNPCQPLEREAVATWRWWSEQAAAVLRVVAHLRADRTAAASDWDTLAAPGPWVDDVTKATVGQMGRPSVYLPEQPGDLASERRLACVAIDTWLAITGVRLTVDWDATRAGIRLATHGLLGSLGGRILLAAVGVDSLAPCWNCGDGHIPKRPHATQWHSYCPRCRTDKVPGAIASATYRRAEKENPARAKQAKGRRVQRLRAAASD